MAYSEAERDISAKDAAVRRLLSLAKIKVAHPAPFSNITKLDIFDCGISSLPDSFAEAFPELSILFLSKNKFKEMPKMIGDCPKLQMVSFKDNMLATIHPDALQPQMRWLILTNNRLSNLPESIGRCQKLQKFMLSGNQVESLPDTIRNCISLELIRLASNKLKEPPTAILEIPSLRWVALSGNPFLQHLQPSSEALDILEEVEESIGEVLGQGAGGVTRKVLWRDRVVAVKEYNGAMTSDGLPEEERRISCAASALNSACFIEVLGETQAGSLVMEYLDQYSALAGPPSFETCSRDVYTDSVCIVHDEQAEKILSHLLEALAKLHSVGICHGDFYGHNILVSQDGSDVRLSDFGAAFFYDREHEYGTSIEAIELRSFAVLVEEVNSLLKQQSERLDKLVRKCREQDCSFAKLHIWWKQLQLAGLASAFAVDA